MCIVMQMHIVLAARPKCKFKNFVIRIRFIRRTHYSHPYNSPHLPTYTEHDVFSDLSSSVRDLFDVFFFFFGNNCDRLTSYSYGSSRLCAVPVSTIRTRDYYVFSRTFSDKPSSRTPLATQPNT